MKPLARKRTDSRKPKTAVSRAARVTPERKDATLASPASTAAPAQALSFSLQQTRLLARLLISSPGDVVSLEVIDDVGVHRADGTVISEQDKSNLAHNPLSDRAIDLWKTIANWVVETKAGTLDPAKTIYVLYVAVPGTAGAIASSFNDARDEASALAAINAARTELWGDAPKYPKAASVAVTLRPFLDAVIPPNKSNELAAIVARMEIVQGSGRSLDDLKPLFMQKLVSEDNYDVVLRWARNRSGVGLRA